METAIKKAIEGGYEENKYVNDSYHRDLFDPLFWQALGKAEGWYEAGLTEPQWIYEWHLLIDHLISSKDINSFFETLLANKEKE